MKSNGHLVPSVVAILLMAIMLASGCGKSGSSVTPVAPVKPTPEASFERIMETLKRRIQDVPSGFIAQQGGGHSRMVASNTISSELISPTTGGDPYRAVVTVVSKSRYSIQRPVGEPDDAKENGEQEARSSGASSLDDPSGLTSGLEIVDPDLATPSTGGERRDAPKAEAVVTRRVDEDVRKFELEYRNGRWVLLTKTNPETERSIQSAFDEALGAQI